MTIETTGWAMFSDRTLEHAFRVDGAGDTVWRLSWLPDHRLTHAQAVAGMELDELLNDPGAVHDEAARREVAHRAAALGVRYEEAVILLSRQMIGRMWRYPGDGAAPEPEPEPVPSGTALPGGPGEFAASPHPCG